MLSRNYPRPGIPYITVLVSYENYLKGKYFTAILKFVDCLTHEIYLQVIR